MIKRWCHDNSRTKKPKAKKSTAQDMYSPVKDYLFLKYEKDSKIYAEEVAEHFKIKTHIVKQVFHKLNLEGTLSQAHNWRRTAMHTRNDPYGDVVVNWGATWYYFM